MVLQLDDKRADAAMGDVRVLEHRAELIQSERNIQGSARRKDNATANPARHLPRSVANRKSEGSTEFHHGTSKGSTLYVLLNLQEFKLHLSLALVDAQ